MDNEMIELSDHQIFSMDCKRTVEGLSRYNTCVNNNNEEKKRGGWGRGYSTSQKKLSSNPRKGGDLYTSCITFL